MKKVWAASLAHARLWQSRIDALEYVMNGLYARERWRSVDNSHVRTSHTTLLLELYKHRDEALATVLSMGVVDDAVRLQAAKIAFEVFLPTKPDNQIMHLLSPTGTAPGSWHKDEEERLRSELQCLEENVLGKRRKRSKKKKPAMEDQA
jgi:hypothetical protein